MVTFKHVLTSRLLAGLKLKYALTTNIGLLDHAEIKTGTVDRVV